MPRTWTLVDTLTLGGNHQLHEFSNVVTDGAGNAYFWTVDAVASPGILVVWKWDGMTLTNISGTTFESSGAAGFFGVKLCWFAGELYFAYSDPQPSFTEGGHIYKYSGSGQSWSEDHEFVDDLGGPVNFRASSTISNRNNHPFDSDGSRLVAVGGADSPFDKWMVSKTGAGGSWTLQTMPGGSHQQPYWTVVGNNKNSSYGELLATNEPGASGTFRTIVHGTPDWANLSGSDIGARYLIGYADGKAFYVQDDGADFKIYYSTDWGVNLTYAGVDFTNKSYRLSINFNNLASDAVMIAKRATNQAYVWNPATNQFDADGTTGTNIDVGFFVLGSTLYALCAPASGATVRIYTGGPVSGGPGPGGGAAKFYYAINALVERSDMPFGLVNPSGMAVRSVDGKVALGGDGVGGGGEIAITKVVDDNYVADTDITGSHATDNPINGIQWINGTG